MAVFAWRGWMPRILAVTMLCVNTACLILTFSRGGWVGMLVSIFVSLLLLMYWYSTQLPPFWRTWSLPLLLGVVSLLLLVAVLFVEPVRDRVFSIFGPGNTAFNKIYPLYQRPRFTALSAYSMLLEVAVETGFIGLACFFWLLLVIFHQGMLHLQRLRSQLSHEGFWLMGAIATLSGMLAHNVADTVWYRPEVNTLWWLMVALIASYSSLALRRSRQSILDRP